MITFNDYFGYGKSRSPNRCSQKIKMMDGPLIVDLSGSGRSSNKKYKIGSKKKQSRNNSSSRSRKGNLKRSPFKVIDKKNPIAFEYKQKEKSTSKRNQKPNPAYQRFYTQDCKTKKYVVEKKKDQVINQYFQRKKQETCFQNKLQNRISPKNKNHHKTPHKHTQPFIEIKHLTEQSSPVSDKKAEVEQISIQSALQQEDELQLVRQEKQNSFIDDYQIKQSVASQLKKMPELQNNINQSNTIGKGRIGLSERKQLAKNQLLMKLQTHIGSIGRLLQLIYETNKFYESNEHVFIRQNYLLKRMYFRQICAMAETLRHPERKNCFVLQSCRISKSELYRLRSEHSSQVQIKIKLIQKQIQELETILKRQSKLLIDKNPNDPYLHLHKQNFEPELINELYEQITSITEKLNIRQALNDRGGHEERRYHLICLIFLIGQACKMKENSHVPLTSTNYKKYYEENEDLLLDVVQKFQDMPL